jgi:hypothetical protein
MRYPIYPSQPFTGDLPSMVDVGPSDTRYSSGTAPRYEAPFDRRYGRRLAGTDIDVEDESATPGTALNELNLLAEMDDIQDNGIFDPPGNHPNIHPDAGVFAARYSLPGYHAREIPFSKTEVRDATTGRQVVAVPSGAVSLDSAAQIAFIEQGLYKTPQSVMDWQSASPMPDVSIANWMQNPQSIAGFGDAATTTAVASTGMSPTAKLMLTTAVVGASAGVLYALFSKKKGKR